MPEPRIYDSLGSFSAGINSGIDPLLLQKNQMAFATNATVRGDFVKQRPNYRKLDLVYENNATQTAFQTATALFQASTYFRNIGNGKAYLMLAVGGKLFRIDPTIQDGSANVFQVALPDNLQNQTVTQHWMWQSERWLIWNDGVNNPFFYDGLSVRRSIGNQTAALNSITPSDISIPAIGQTIKGAGIDKAFQGYVGQPVIIGSQNNWAQFVVTAAYINNAAATTNITAKTLSSTVGDKVSGALFNRPVDYLGLIRSVTYNGNEVTNWNQIPAATAGTPALAFTFTVPIDANVYPSGATGSGVATKPMIYVGSIIYVNNEQCKITAYSQYGTNGYISSITCYPLNTSANGKSNGGGVLIPADGNHVSVSFAVAATGTMQANTSSQSYPFVITMDRNWTQGAIIDHADIKCGNVAITLRSVNNTAWTCELLTAQSGVIPKFAAGSYPDTTNNIVQNATTHTTSTLVGTNNSVDQAVPTTGTATYNLVSSGAQINVGDVLTFLTTSNTTDIVIVTAISFTSASSANVIDIQNVTGTEGTILPVGSSVYPIPEIPASTIGVYGMGRNWVCLPDGKSFLGCDLVGTSSGTPDNKYTDAVLRISQNQGLAGGGTFYIPNTGGTIKAMQFVAALDASLGQGALQVLTNSNIFSCNATPDIMEWSKLTNPILTESLIGAGAVSQTSVTQENNDLLFRSSDGGVRSMLLARLDFNKWGNTPISREVVRSLRDDDKSLLAYCSATIFNNRLLMACKPVQSLRGVYHTSLVSLNFDQVSSLQGKQPSAWEAEWNGLNILQFVSGFFNDQERAFAICIAKDNANVIEINEILLDEEAVNDFGGTQVSWSFETPVLFNELSHSYKRLINGELYFKDVKENIRGTVYYKPDQNADWQLWNYFGAIYDQTKDPQYRSRIGLGSPKADVFDSVNNQPLREGYSFQLKIEITGACTFVGGRFAADVIPQPQFANPKGNPDA